MPILILATALLVLYWVLEYLRHSKNVNKIPYRIHVNGTRGKSSVTRLIAGGLRQGDKKTVAKTTGTLPRIILDDGSESAIVRLAGANIIEQKYIFRHTAKLKPEVLVMECMAVNPVFQWITERKFVKSTVSVITNVRLDHTDQMGEDMTSITKSLCNSIPKNGVVYTAEDIQFDLMKKIADARNTEIKLIRPEDANLTAEEMKEFAYIEHKENIALALAVCKHMGVSREVALKGMQQMRPDPGALKKYLIKDSGKEINFYNVFAANDPDSTKFIFNMITAPLTTQQVVLILNSRADRYFRSIQLLDVCKELEFDHLLLTGERTVQLYQDALARKIPKEKIHQLGEPEPIEVYAKVKRLTKDESHVLGIGNIAGQRKYGGQIVNEFSQRSKEASK